MEAPDSDSDTEDVDPEDLFNFKAQEFDQEQDLN